MDATEYEAAMERMESEIDDLKQRLSEVERERDRLKAALELDRSAQQVLLVGDEIGKLQTDLSICKEAMQWVVDNECRSTNCCCHQDAEKSKEALVKITKETQMPNKEEAEPCEGCPTSPASCKGLHACHLSLRAENRVLTQLVQEISDVAGSPSHCLKCEQVWELLNKALAKIGGEGEEE